MLQGINKPRVHAWVVAETEAGERLENGVDNSRHCVAAGWGNRLLNLVSHHLSLCNQRRPYISLCALDRVHGAPHDLARGHTPLMPCLIPWYYHPSPLTLGTCPTPIKTHNTNTLYIVNIDCVSYNYYPSYSNYNIKTDSRI